MLSDDAELLGRLLWNVDGVDISTGLDISERHLETETTVTTRDNGSLALQGELGEDGGSVVVW